MVCVLAFAQEWKLAILKQSVLPKLLHNNLRFNRT